MDSEPIHETSSGWSGPRCWGPHESFLEGLLHSLDQSAELGVLRLPVAPDSRLLLLAWQGVLETSVHVCVSMTQTRTAKVKGTVRCGTLRRKESWKQESRHCFLRKHQKQVTAIKQRQVHTWFAKTAARHAKRNDGS